MEESREMLSVWHDLNVSFSGHIINEGQRA